MLGAQAAYASIALDAADAGAGPAPTPARQRPNASNSALSSRFFINAVLPGVPIGVREEASGDTTAGRVAFPSLGKFPNSFGASVAPERRPYKTQKGQGGKE
ncbi:hypothetical protein Msi02_66130 [Microbispora siamensis]|uniref:Uncharacterized protein n=1 Tax=Microbispora siamensis TaxID=564413 RepID=A0ABQ4GWK6_9ACTN|nr:hypothetical protein Msi02_66130 [Microbispora siamensis]